MLYFGGLLFLISSLCPCFFGSKYLLSGVLLGPLTVVMTLFSLFNIMSVYQLSVNKFKYLYGTIFITIAQIVLIAFFHGSIMGVIGILIACSAFIVVVNMYHSLIED